MSNVRELMPVAVSSPDIIKDFLKSSKFDEIDTAKVFASLYELVPAEFAGAEISSWFMNLYTPETIILLLNLKSVDRD